MDDRRDYDCDCEDAFLDEVWTVRFHDPEDPDWTTPSYVRLADVASAGDFAELCLALRGKVAAGMFFMMREHVFPCWDDRANLEGGCVCIKLPKAQAQGFWEALCARALTEELGEGVNGVSVSPKSVYSIAKVWTVHRLDGSALESLKKKLPTGFVGDLLFRANRENIQAVSESISAQKSSM